MTELFELVDEARPEAPIISSPATRRVVKTPIMEREVINSRFTDALWLPSNKTYSRIALGGLGGIGSNLVYLLSKLEIPSIEVFEMDTIEGHNIGGQLFLFEDLGNSKINGSRRIIAKTGSRTILAEKGELKELDLVSNIAFSCFDNMKARQIFFNSWKARRYLTPNRVSPIFIDGRQNAEHFEVFAVTEKTIKKYEEEYLFPDGDVEDLPCNFKATCHTGFMTASTMLSIFTNHVYNFVVGTKIREVPFRTEFNIPMMLYENS